MSARLPTVSSGLAATRTFLLTDWVTWRGNTTTVAGATQDDSQWLDLSGFSDATFWIEVADLTSPGSVLLNLESSPTLDESTFAPVVTPISLSPSTTPLVVKTVSAVSTFPLSRLLRCRISTTGSGAWSVTMRIRVVANRSRYFVPTQISGCSLWLRADLGVTLAPSNPTNVTTWKDQSGNGNDASQGTTANQPTYVPSAINALPAIQGDGAARFMTTAAFTIGSAATLCAVVEPLGSMNGYTRILEQQYNTTYYLGTDSSQTKYKLIVNNGTSPYGVAQGGTVTTNAPAIVTGVYGSPTGSLYINGALVAADSFTAPTPASQVLYIMQAYNGFAEYWNGYLAEAIVYNRALSTAELTRVHRYLGRRYGVVVP